jgi:hypothetical protein
MDWNIDNWSMIDPNADQPLDQIPSLPSRARSLLIRNRTNPWLKTWRFVGTVGAIEMLSAMEYHRNNFINLVGKLAKGLSSDHEPVTHEAVAYVNRLGQFYYFGTSDNVISVFRDAGEIIPTFVKKNIFRRKYAAHRSMDRPQGESEHEKLYQAQSLSIWWGKTFQQRPDRPSFDLQNYNDIEELERDQWANNYRIFKIPTGRAGEWIRLNIEVEHSQLMAEGYDLVQKLILIEKDTPEA